MFWICSRIFSISVFRSMAILEMIRSLDLERIARAMVGGPELLLADEPTGALDTAAGYQIMEIFRSLADQGMTILMITHEPSIAACADKTYHILDGQLLDQAPEIPAAPPHPQAEKSDLPAGLDHLLRDTSKEDGNP